ncbi:TetR/AcrR family transcriptional regulator [Mycobacterium sp.]|uniref:TetR/AcrR family transcriptional regulator n=1 Tax=Mycobacterium sp. TaxID=1785 RepID=UPI002D8F47CC|nr:TetR/AcrR family transcriptional regulator [Mycobacterium sp.]
MARPRMFDEEQALEGAMRLFWSSGYDATSTEELCEATGLRRSSIYNTFRSKHELFLQALSRYLVWKTGAYLELLTGESPAAERVHEMLRYAADQAAKSGRDGCFAVNTITERSSRDPEVDALLRADTSRRIAAIRDVLAAGQRVGEVDRAKDPDALANFIDATLAGIHVAARGGKSRRTLRAIADTAVLAL